MHLLRFRDEFIPELGMGNIDETLGALPGGLALGIELAVLRHQPVEVGAGAGSHGAFEQRGADTGL